MITSQLNPLQGGLFYLISLQCDLFLAELSTRRRFLAELSLVSSLSLYKVKLKSLHGRFWVLNSLHEDLFVAEFPQRELLVAELSTEYMIFL